jgi:hypothetical protein
VKKALGDKHIIAFETDHLMPGEAIQNWVLALRKGDALQGRLITTEERLVFYRKGMVSHKLEVWPVSKVSSVEAKSGILSTKLAMYTSGDKIELEIFGDKRHAKEFVNELQLAVNRPVGNGETKSTEPSDPMKMLAELAKLRDAGIVTDDEFSAKKAELLAKI